MVPESFNPDLSQKMTDDGEKFTKNGRATLCEVSVEYSRSATGVKILCITVQSTTNRSVQNDC